MNEQHEAATVAAMHGQSALAPLDLEYTPFLEPLPAIVPAAELAALRADLERIEALLAGALAEDERKTARIAQHPFVGRYCICRCTGAGVHAGEVVSVDGDTVILRDSRRLWQWTATAGVALSGVAQHGIKAGASKLDVTNPEIYLIGVCELIPCSAVAKESIQNV